MSEDTHTIGAAGQIETEVLAPVFEYSNDAICIVNLDDDTIVECNPAATELFGFPRKKLLSMSASELHPHNFEAFQAFADSVIEEGSGWTDDITCYGKGGEEIPSEISATVYETDGQTCLISIIRDISERHQREQELQRENERLEIFANIVSHDLRNPLNVIAGHLDMAKQEVDSDLFETIESALDRAFDIIDESVTLAKHGQGPVEGKPVRLGEVIETCWRNVETGPGELCVESDCEILADPDRLRHIVENLIHNAVEHGEENTTITVGALSDGFYLADSGPGIPESERERIFDPGYSTAEGGTGYGLAIANHMAETHGWTMAVTGSEDGGARFEITGVKKPGGSESGP